MSKFLEKTILNKVDQLIDVVIKLSDENDIKKDLLKEEALEKGLDLIPLLLHFLNGNISHVEPMYHQLIMEKLPDPRIMSSFGNFQNELNIVFKEVMEIFLKNPQSFQENSHNAESVAINSGKNEQAEENDYISEDELPTTLQDSVLKAFPTDKIIFNYPIRGQTLEVFLPEHNLALLSDTNSKKYLKLNYFCKKLGIILAQVPSEVGKDPRRLLRFIKRINK